jgi:hypothetical protein
MQEFGMPNDELMHQINDFYKSFHMIFINRE